MKNRKLTAAAAILSMAMPAAAHDVPVPDGHITSTFNYGFEVIGRDVLAGVITGL